MLYGNNRGGTKEANGLIPSQAEHIKNTTQIFDIYRFSYRIDLITYVMCMRLCIIEYNSELMFHQEVGSNKTN